ncbi:MAG TPA: DUF1583 domain-containing protein [Pirellulales bacterium]|nr:DUF1583 domain-containing protein [Pirellulales bacterium]
MAAMWPVALLAQVPDPAGAEKGAPSADADPQRTLSRPITLAQFEQAAQIADLAAEHGLYELSQRAILRALANGPPVQVEPMLGLGKPQSRLPTVRHRTATRRPPSVDSQVSQRLSALVQKWRQGAPVEAVYQTLAAIVLPPQRPREIFLYHDPSGSAPATELPSGFVANLPAQVAASAQVNGSEVSWPTVGQMLVDAATQAGRIDDLQQRMAARDGKEAEFGRSVLLAQLTLTSRNVDVATCWPHLRRLASHDPPFYVAELLREVAIGIEGPEMPADMVAWLETTLEQQTNNDRRIADDRTRLKLLLALARWQVANGHLDLARRHLKRYAELGLGGEGGNNDERERYHATRWLRVAREFVRAGLLDDTLDSIAKHVDAAEVTDDEPLMVPVWLGSRRLLLEEPAAQRYHRLASWTMPQGEPRQLRFVGCAVHRDGRPSVFQTELYRSSPDDTITSNFQLLVDAAREARLLDDLEQRLVEFSTDSGVKVVALRAMLALETGHEEQVVAGIERLCSPQPAADGGPPRVGQPMSPASYLLTRACLGSAGWREHGAVLAGILSPRHRNLTGLLDLEQAAVIRRDLGLERPGLSEPGFAHWQITRAGQNWTMPIFVPSLWARDADYLRCVSGKGTSSLLLMYPLIGSGELSVDLLGGGGSIGYGGIWIGSRGVRIYDDAFPASLISSNPLEANPIPPPVPASSGVNRWTLHVEPGKNQLRRNDDVVADLPEPSPAAPWMVLSSWLSTDATFHRLQITGEWRIPREVSLVGGDRLVGWITGFYEEPPSRLLPRLRPGRRSASEPPVETAPLLPRPRAGRRTASEAPGETAPSTATRGNRFRDIPFASLPTRPRAKTSLWIGNSGTILAAPFSTGETTPAPSRLTYFRPLRNGEALRYEFLRDAQTMVHPALDRLTFLLEPEGVRLHWMTDHPDAEAGDLPLDNVVDEPAARRGPARLPLIEGDWNRVVLKLVDDEILIELNDVLVFQRKLESTNDRRFSFFYYRDRTQATIRSVVLTGDWPETLPPPGELFAPRRPLSEAELEAEKRLVNAKRFEIAQPTAEEKAP